MRSSRSRRRTRRSTLSSVLLPAWQISLAVWVAAHASSWHELRRMSKLMPKLWEEHYAERDRVWSGRVNVRLAEVAESLPPGRALDLGCGEGGDAMWLAERGWHVTAVDISQTALDRAAADARSRNLSGAHRLPATRPSRHISRRGLRPGVGAVSAFHGRAGPSESAAPGRGRRFCKVGLCSSSITPARRPGHRSWITTTSSPAPTRSSIH